MNAARAIIVGLFVLLLAVPFFAHRARSGDAGASMRDAERLIVVTPHVEQIRVEFARAFSRWHQRHYGKPVIIDYRTPGGTTEILKLLESQYTDRVRSGLISTDGRAEPGVVDFDVMFGGGTFDHGRLRRGVTLTMPDGQGGSRPVTVRMSAPPSPPFDEEFLNRVYGSNMIGPGQLWQDHRRDASGDVADPNDWQHWFGTALSGFGIVYNRPLLAERGLPEPRSFEDLTDPRYHRLLALADPRQSGSVATLFDSILNNAAREAMADLPTEVVLARGRTGKPDVDAAYRAALSSGFDRGFRLLRRLCGNARYFATASTQPPQDVGQGDALAGVAIDFYGRGQAQALLRPGQAPEEGRLGYVDPEGAVYIDADPVSILRGAPNPTLARRFVEFCLTDEAQALWQFPPLRDPRRRPGMPDPALTAPRNPDAPDLPLGPEEYRLRRMPVLRSMYAQYLEHFADRTNPFEIASNATVQGWRDGLIVMMGAFGIDAGRECRQAYRLLCLAEEQRRRAVDSAKAQGRSPGPQDGFPAAALARMQAAFYAMPLHRMADGRELEFNAENYTAISADVRRWTDPIRAPLARIAYTQFFKQQYREVIAIAREHGLR
jgi:ABC-type Fe3+ transport system substrate-binding protein